MAVLARIFLTGDPCLLGAGRVVSSGRFPGRQGVLTFAYLVSERRRPVPREELAELVWPRRLPGRPELDLSAVVSKLRALLSEVGLPRGCLAAGGGCYRLEFPAEVWIDTEAALAAVHEAEGALRSGMHRGAYGPAVVAAAILHRPFLPGAEGAWVDARRQALRGARVRALDVLAEVHEWNREPALALRAAEEAIALEPYRESGYRRLMRIHQRAGDRAEALRVYARCRRLLAAELGEEPAPETEALRAELTLPAGARPRP